ncbi:hypothetical protein BDF20DRAFT_819905 [Mycotypha africana]|uniref:uncharacterized protein n=1 Tax=Mycotypha africana TaxID=64632 RepID=UPI0023004370|nr:uncharacterized protein BDF20DRAFT_819905 [Mycotypha africana]KAI8979577.1 hypothetical protein BDF20DRAFT_819905 [Mycotypha africana]
MDKQTPTTQQQHHNTSDVDDSPPPAYEEAPAFNPNYPAQSSSIAYPSPHFNSHYNLYPQAPPSGPVSHVQYQRHNYHPQQQQYHTYQAIEIPYPVGYSNQQALLRLREENRRFPLAALLFLFGWFCPPLWIIGACCCAGSNNSYEAFWGKVNFTMAMILIISSIVYSAFAMSEYNIIG